MSEIRINIRTNAAIKEAVQDLAKKRGMEMTSLVNGLISDELRKERKSEQVNVRTRNGLKGDLETLAYRQGLSLSSYIHSLLVREVRKEKQERLEQAEAAAV